MKNKRELSSKELPLWPPTESHACQDAGIKPQLVSPQKCLPTPNTGEWSLSNTGPLNSKAFFFSKSNSKENTKIAPVSQIYIGF